MHKTLGEHSLGLRNLPPQLALNSSQWDVIFLHPRVYPWLGGGGSNVTNVIPTGDGEY